MLRLSSRLARALPSASSAPSPWSQSWRRQASTGGRKAILTAIGPSPEAALKHLEVVDQEPVTIEDGPEGKNDVVVRVKSAAVHWVDLLMMMGQYQHAPLMPYTPGMEFSGVVEAVGEGVTHVKVGDDVFTDIFHSGPRSYDERYQRNGGFATRALAPAHAIRLIPPGLDFDQAAVLGGAYETAYHALVACCGLRRGETALIQGATGASGLAAVQIASAVGASIVATGGSDEKLELVKEQALGDGKIIATHNYRTGGNMRPLREVVKEATGGEGVDVVFDTVGGLGIAEESLRCLRFGGRYGVVGWTSTPYAGGGRGAGAVQESANALPTNLIMMKSAKVFGCPVAIATKQDPSIRPPRLAALDAWIACGYIRPLVSHKSPLEDCGEALMQKWGRKVTGGAVVQP